MTASFAVLVSTACSKAVAAIAETVQLVAITVILTLRQRITMLSVTASFAVLVSTAWRQAKLLIPLVPIAQLVLIRDD